MEWLRRATEANFHPVLYGCDTAVKHIFFFNCDAGVKMLADCIASAINKMDWLSAAQLTKSDIETYVDLNPALEEDGKTLMCKCLLYLILLFYFYSLASSISGIEDFGIGFYKPFLFFLYQRRACKGSS